jgi:hypothetical protein
MRSALPLTAALLLACAAAAHAAPRSTTAGPAARDSMRSYVAKDFEIYARTEDELRRANVDVRYATAQILRYIGDWPPKTAFFVFGSPEELKAADLSRISASGLPIMTWVSERPPHGQRLPGFDPNLPAKCSTRDNPYPFSHGAAHFLYRTYVDLALADLARKGEPSAADSGKWGAAGARAPAVAPSPTNPGHAGHAALPAWFCEAVATLCEPPALQEARLRFMQAHLDQRIPFGELLAMREPPAAGTKRVAKSGGASPVKRAKGAAPGTGLASASAIPDRATIFSSEALSLARFIAAREYDRFIGVISEGMIRGRTFGDIVNKSQTLYSKPEALEQSWVEWVKQPGGAERQ